MLEDSILLPQEVTQEGSVLHHGWSREAITYQIVSGPLNWPQGLGVPKHARLGC